MTELLVKKYKEYKKRVLEHLINDVSGLILTEKKKSNQSDFSEKELACLPDQLVLFKLSADLWFLTGKQEYEEDLYNGARKLMRFAEYDNGLPAGQTYGKAAFNFLLGLIVSSDVALDILCKFPEFACSDHDVFWSAGCIDKAVNIAAYFQESGNEDYAHELIFNLREQIETPLLKFESIEAHNFNKGILYLDLFMYYIDYDLERAMNLHDEHYHLMQLTNPGYYAVYCRVMAFQLETIDIAKSLKYIDLAYEYMPSLTDETQKLFTRSCYYAYHSLDGDNSHTHELFAVLNQLEELEEDSTVILYKIRVYQALLSSDLYSNAQKYLEDALYYLDLVYTAIETQPETLNSRFSPVQAELAVFSGYFNTNQKILAINALKEAIDWCQAYDDAGTLEFYALSSLVTIYQTSNFMDEARPLARRLFEKIIRKEVPDDISQDSISLALICYITIVTQEKHYVYAAKLLKQLQDLGYFSDFTAPNYYITIMISIDITLGNHDSLENNERITALLRQMESFEISDSFDLDILNKFIYQVAMGMLNWRLGNKEVYASIKYKLPDYTTEIPIYLRPNMTHSYSVLIAMAMESNDYRYAYELCQIIQDISKEMLALSLTLQQRNRLVEYSGHFDNHRRLCYSVYRGLRSLRESYNIILNWKNILSLMTAFKNSAVEQLHIDKHYIEELNHYFDQKAYSQLASIYGKSKLDESIENNLDFLEAQMATYFDREVKITNFDTEELMDALPDNSIFLDYVIHYDKFYLKYLYPYYLDGDALDEHECIDLYCFRKSSGLCSINRYPIVDDKLLENTCNVVSKELKRSRHKKLEKYLKFLYERLILPIEEELNGISNLYISPESGMNVIPFDILLNEAGEALAFKHTVILVDSGRDFIRQHSDNYSDHFLIIGSPAYDYKDTPKEQALKRSFNRSECIYPLPFSELETHIIGDEYGVKPYTGINANKTIIEKMKESRWIHMATHGAHGISESSTDSWYSCVLFLAGAENWRREGVFHPIYGNGILTADEIRRMDLHGTEMVVLSACYTASFIGTSDMASICAAFRDAGVKYVISTLWGIDEIPSTLFMRKFYRNLKSYDVPTALRLAKEYLRHLTAKAAISTLRRLLLDQDLEHYEFIVSCITKMEAENHPEKECIFSDPYYWSGFICHQNLF